MCSSQFWLTQGIALLAALASTAVAVLAIWGDPIRRRLTGAQLELDVLDPMGEPMNLTTGAPARFYHLRVRNLRPHVVTTNTQVLLTRLARPAADGSFQPGPGDLGAGVPLTRQHGHTMPRTASLGPPANYDLVSVVKNVGAQLSLVFVPNNLDPNIPTNIPVRLELVAVSDQAQSPPRCVEIAWDGQWSDDTAVMANHFVVKRIPRI